MKLKKWVSALTAAVLSLTAFAVRLPDVHAAEYSAQKTRVSVHDPSVIRDPKSGTYYVFGSHIEAAKSADLQNWKSFANGYAKTNNRLFGNLSENLKPAFAWAGENLEDCEGGFAVWAPDVVWDADYLNSDGSRGAYLMYFCTSSTYMRSVIAFATAQNIEGPYTFADTLIYSGFTDNDSFATSSTKNVNRKYTSTNIDELIAQGQVTYNNSWFRNHNFNNQLFPNAIDPTIYYDTAGRMYMCYGSWSGGIFTLEIDKQTGKCIHPKSGTTSDGRMVDSYFGTKISGGYGKSGEGPFIEYNAETGFYYLFVTYGGLTSAGGYNMRVGRSRNPLGPFTDPAGRNMVLPENPNLNATGLKLMTNYMLPSLQRAYMACGHNSVLRDDDGKWYLVYHTRFDDGAEYHEVRVHALNFNEAGWPVAAPYEYSGDDWSENGYEVSALAGTYAFLNHGTGTDGTITKTADITLNADGTVSGAVSGTWQEAGSGCGGTLTIGKVKYRGVFHAQYDESGTGKRVMTFTGCGNDNQTVWAVQTAPWNGSERNPLYNYIGSGLLFYDKNASPDLTGAVYVGDTDLLSNVPYLLTNVNSGLLLSTADASAEEGTKLVQWAPAGSKSGDPHQNFRITDAGNGYCRLTTMIDETKCVAVAGMSAENALDIEIQTYTGADNQLWKLVCSGDYYGIVSKCSGDSAGLDVYEWSTENGGAVKQWEFWGGECQLWRITPTYAMIPAGSYALRSVNGGLFAGSYDGSVVLRREPEIWQLSAVPDSGLKMLSDRNGFCMTAAGQKEGAAVVLKREPVGDAQSFSVWCNADGSYSVLPVTADGKAAFDEEGTDLATGDPIVLKPYTAAVSQRFVLIPAKMPEPDPPAVTTTLTTATTETTTTTTVLQKRMPGDANCDGVIDVSDGVLVAKFASGDSTAHITDQGIRNADCNMDSNVTTDDLTLILRHIAKISLLPGTE
ncbi:MAG: RICIN domain-containing protein [Oscillospiraceae bacterium]|nr:RICIN domain-containing protein [Oscillospiraceae bacterium]